MSCRGVSLTSHGITCTLNASLSCEPRPPPCCRSSLVLRLLSNVSRIAVACIHLCDHGNNDRYKSPLTLNDFNIDRTLGEGAFGRVVLATVKATAKWDKKNDKFVAVKCLEKQQVLDESQVEHTTNEKNLLFCLECPMIAKFYDFMVDRENST